MHMEDITMVAIVLDPQVFILELIMAVALVFSDEVSPSIRLVKVKADVFNRLVEEAHSCTFIAFAEERPTVSFPRHELQINLLANDSIFLVPEDRSIRSKFSLQSTVNPTSFLEPVHVNRTSDMKPIFNGTPPPAVDRA